MSDLRSDAEAYAKGGACDACSGFCIGDPDCERFQNEVEEILLEWATEDAARDAQMPEEEEIKL